MSNENEDVVTKITKARKEQEMKGKDQAAIERQASALDQEASRVLRQAETQAAAPSPGAPGPGGPGPGGPADDDVVDAEFEEVN